MTLQSLTHKKAMIEALKETLGIVTNACKQVGISRQTHYDWLKTDEDYRNEVESISDIALDFVESKLFEQIKNDKETSTIFYLKTKGKKRGYIEKSEQDINMTLREINFEFGNNDEI